MSGERISKQERAQDEETVETLGDAALQGAEVTPGLEEAIDDILDEIDDVLETNAEEFVKSYIQKGGE